MKECFNSAGCTKAKNSSSSVHKTL